MDNHTISKKLCKLLEGEFDTSCPTDDQITTIPKDAKFTVVYNSLGTKAAKIVNTGRKRPDHAEFVRQQYASGEKIKPKGLSHKGHKHSEESKKLIGMNGGITRLGKKRGSYVLVNRQISPCSFCGRIISGAGNMTKHVKVSHG